ncbi:hypothetical protein CH333_00140 [candidate division WOR-3 bacterium JGI_Cruoil_03_44_89]|uniref:CopG family transcriptional regulator n=1 Tax=candidate division WOR-3 bacterium JGI_Cruoil_03_44_89 TaxID=1973748 RepID=A0A235BZD3_UNCW3|nr:MAG: hypothetical protein CH333_00140 [candidate division WOR-3 bacterium JGI_Cruoil_03_44_89]
MKRLNITLPEDLAQELEAISNKSRFIAEAVKERLERIRREKLDKLLVEGYKATCREDREVDKEWEEITLESWK